MNSEKRPVLICNDGLRQYPIVPECTEFGKQHRGGRYEVLGYFLPQEEFNAYVAEAEKLIDELYDKVDALQKSGGISNDSCPFVGNHYDRHKQNLKKAIVKYLNANYPEIKNCRDDAHVWASSFISEIDSTISSYILHEKESSNYGK